jgi:hypothetical protein
MSDRNTRDGGNNSGEDYAKKKLHSCILRSSIRAEHVRFAWRYGEFALHRAKCLDPK